MTRKTKGTPDEIDVYVGARLRARRIELKLSQEKLAENIGLTFQQIQKYERGTNRVAAGRLYQLAHVMETTIDYFFPDDDREIESGPTLAKELLAANAKLAKIGKLLGKAQEIAGGA